MAARVLAGASLFPGPGPLRREHWLKSPAPQLQRMDRLCALGVCVADDVLGAARAADQAQRSEAQPTDDVAVVFASAYGCHATDEDFYLGFLEGGAVPAAASPRLFVYTLPSSPVGEVSIHYGLRGPGLCEVSGEVSGVLALGEALRILERGRARRVLALAAEVETALNTRLRGPVRDGAVALVLENAGDGESGRGQLSAVAQRYVPEAPEAALRAVVAELRTRAEAAILCASPALALPPELADGALQDEGLYPARSGAVGALHAVAQLPRHGYRAALVVAADPSGNAAGLLWESV